MTETVNLDGVPWTMTPEFRKAITRCTRDSREGNPTVVTWWVGDLPAFTVPVGYMSRDDSLILNLEGGYTFELEDLAPKPAPRIPLRRRIQGWLNS